MRQALVFGASGQLGDALLPLLRATACAIYAVSRQRREDDEGLCWIAGGLDASLALPRADFDAVFSLGPLDLFARWQEHAGPVAARVVAFGSTSLATKSESVDAGERGLAGRLRAAEESLFAFGARHGVDVVVLRPTLVYGRGRDRSLTRIAEIARHRGMFALPRNATGLRQPVHVDDLAAAALAVAQARRPFARAYDLPGGETLPYHVMVTRMLSSLPMRPRLLRLPTPLFRALVGGASAVGAIRGVNAAMLGRLDADLVFDASEASRDFGYDPRPFAPEAAMFEPLPQVAQALQ